MPLTYWTVVTLAGEEKLVSEMKCGCAAASCTGTTSRAAHGVLQGQATEISPQLQLIQGIYRSASAKLRADVYLPLVHAQLEPKKPTCC